MRALGGVAKSERFIHTAGIAMIIGGAGYLAWLFAFAMNWSAWWLAIPVGAAHLQTYLAGMLFLFNVWHHDRVTPLPPIEGRSVDVFIPTLNESYAVLAPTVIAACAIGYPHRTYVLDDGRREWVRDLC